MYGTQEPEGEGIMTLMANPISRRNMLGATAAGSLVTAATLARAQTAESMPEPKRSVVIDNRPGAGGNLGAFSTHGRRRACDV
jgi:tripartite-type tricarboxylate transporter receptor subunit TctC